MKEVRPLKARITNSAGMTRVDVYDDIGEGGWFTEGLTAKSFANQLSGISGPLEVHINSGGGDVWDGISIKNAIEAHKGPVTTVVDGIAASIASIIAQAGNERVMMPGSMMMIHEASTVAAGDAADMAKMAEILDDVSANLAGIYARSAGGTAEDWRAAMKQETWYSAEQAVAAGLADRTGDGAAVLPFGLDMAAFTAVPGQIAAQLGTLPRAASNVGGGIQDAAEAAGHGAFTSAPTHAHTAHDGPDADGDGFRDHDGMNGDAVYGHTHARPVLGAETMPLTNKALPVHHTATEDSPWDGPAAVAAMPNDDEVLEYCHAWQSADAASTPHEEGDHDADDEKGSYRFPHHRTKGGPANTHACSNGLARLEGSTIPDGDKVGVRAHLQAHLDDAHKGDAGTDNHAGLPAWLTNKAAPLPAWLTNDAEEAK